MKQTPIVTVVGSINMDLTVSTEQVPNKGETVLGKEFATYPGGKGANQAVAAARLGAHVNMIGALGDDVFGKSLKRQLEEEQINTDSIQTINNVATGTATIILSEGDNRIIVAPGANGEVTPDFIKQHEETIKQSDIILLQLEIPVETVEAVTHLAHQHRVPVILNPAPYQTLPSSLLSQISYLTPNEMEAQSLLDDPDCNINKEQLIITNGEKGVSIFKHEVEKVIPGYSVNVIDTTGAGDTFNGALCTQLAHETSLEEAVSFANAAAALSITKLGAQSGMPTVEEVNRFLQAGDDRS